jgi:hypothetical protein
MAEWILLRFQDNYADEFDVDSIVVTTSDRWEKAKGALRAAYPPGATFDASFGTNESLCYSAEGYLSCFRAHPISLECARDLARTLRRMTPSHTYDGGKLAGRRWFLSVKCGVLPRVPGDRLEWLDVLLFGAPPQRCYLHGNVIGECDGGIPCEPDAAVNFAEPDPDYEELTRDRGGAIAVAFEGRRDVELLLGAVLGLKASGALGALGDRGEAILAALRGSLDGADEKPLRRFWVSWWWSNDLPGITVWCTGSRERDPSFSFCAVVDAEDEGSAWEKIAAIQPKAEKRFVIEKPAGWEPPGDRFHPAAGGSR